MLGPNGVDAPTPPSPTASAPPALRAGSASGRRGLSFGACGASAPLAGPSPAPAADAAGRVKSRRPDYLMYSQKSSVGAPVGLLVPSPTKILPAATGPIICWIPIPG